jgi:hypothetical protein
MSDNQKDVMKMSPAEYQAARLAAIRYRPGMSAAEIADLAQRRGSDPPKLATEMTDEEYAKARARAICGKY